MRKVVCAACRCPKTGIIFAGPRHFDETMVKQIGAAKMHEQAKLFEQGFIDQNGVFLKRSEAMEVALQAKQPIDYQRQGNITHELYSEGLY